jgi:hypothetical protein
MVSTILDGRVPATCEHGAMAEHSDETRELLARLFRIADSARGLRVPDTDVVHYDFSPYNLLSEGRPDHGRRRLERRDQRGCRVRSRHPRVSIPTTTPIRRELLAPAAAQTRPRTRWCSTPRHMVLRSVDWTIRNHEEFRGPPVGTSASAPTLLAAVGAE